MRYEGMIYRPPSEANSLLIQATIGCPHNRCTFCGMYKKKKFRIRPVAEILEDLRMARIQYGPYVNSLFFPDGNTIIMKTADLLTIISTARELFPVLERITMYGSARYLLKKSAAELEQLRAAGLTRIHSGMESGDDETLRRIEKGATAEQIIEAGLRVKAADIEISQYMLIGIGGTERSTEHALGSARVLSAIDPDFTRLRTYTPVPKTPLGQQYLSGEFQLPSPHQALRELRLLIEHLDGSNWVVSDHVSNHVNINGRMPEAKPAMLAQIDQALQLDESRFLHNDYRHL